MRGRIAVIVMAVLLVLYLVLVAQKAVLLLLTDNTIARIMGVALLVLPVIGAWALVRELLFGVRSERLARILEAEGGLPEEEVEVRPSGRPLRDEADAVFPAYRAETEASPQSWRAWFRLGIVYDASGDRRRARQAIRRAIALYRADTAQSTA
ncbi:hypothetical protein [Compostimonas suwonensis]|uniref:Uncharacterized protein n=1 Tax=Compostimonas suwonensis TaxID=1048394 RepID=A0A2M9BTR7_9MICO|nr:hypothetical protein [Compostimonas suwonensis]PJJ61354.1 hypothetical protein CLV54_2298 [Compostimonas suwonensis]